MTSYKCLLTRHLSRSNNTHNLTVLLHPQFRFHIPQTHTSDKALQSSTPYPGPS
ncbi:hypothetical protein Hanom_Chr14g01305451 [Helianthus anomalus]